MNLGLEMTNVYVMWKEDIFKCFDSRNQRKNWIFTASRLQFLSLLPLKPQVFICILGLKPFSHVKKVETYGHVCSSMGKSTQQLPDKPVECTICSRKFKNIPALNGHMRLHGGYYKKDADGRRLVGMANTSPLKTVGLNSQQTPTTSAVGAHVTAASAASAATQGMKF